MNLLSADKQGVPTKKGDLWVKNQIGKRRDPHYNFSLFRLQL